MTEGERIALARAAAGYRTQLELAHALGLKARHTVSRWETGARCVPVRKRATVARVLGADESAIWGIAPVERRPPESLRERSEGSPVTRFEAARLRKGWTRARLARVAGFRTAEDIAKIERGVQSPLSRSLVERIATALGVRVADLAGELDVC